MKAKTYAPAVVEAVANALRVVYWYKNDLRSFLTRAGVPAQLVNQLPWDGYKRDVVRTLVDALAASPISGRTIMDKLIDALVEQDERFPHLQKLDDGDRKVDDAQRSVRTLKDLLHKEDLVERANKARNEARTESHRQSTVRQQRQQALADLNARFMQLCASTDAQRRGYDFQVLLRDLFAAHDLDPRGSFAIPGEQTDGSFRLDGTVLLIEARWTQERTSPAEVRDFRSKVHDKLDNTLGLLVSMAGFTDEAITAAAAGGRILVILMDGVDVARIFQGLDDLVDVIKRKLRHAAEQGRPMYRVGQ